MILDATAGYRNLWKGKHQNVVFIDIRREVSPNIIASNEHMPFRDHVFEKVVYDPPHFVTDSDKLLPSDRRDNKSKYGKQWVTKSQFVKNIYRLNIEAKRVLTKTGILHVKHTANPKMSIQTMEMILDNFKTTNRYIYPSKSKSGNKLHKLLMVTT